MKEENSAVLPAKLWNRNYVKVWVANFTLFFSFMLLTPLLPVYLSDAFGADKQTIGIVLAGYTVTTLLIRPFSGFFVDTYPRKIVLLVGFFCFAAMFAGYLVASTLLLFAIVRTVHGFPFGLTTVSNSTVAVDVLHTSRRNEGIGYYGLSNNLATALAPSVALWIYGAYASFHFLFVFSLIVAFVGFAINCTLHLKPRPRAKNKEKMSFDRFILIKGWSQSLCLICYAFSFGIMSTYVTVYGQEEFGITGGTGFFFTLLAVGLIVSRLTGSRSLRKGRIAHNASIGIVVSLCGYALFSGVHELWAYYLSALIIGLGNGHMFPAFQSMFINLTTNDRRGTANSTMLVSWDIGVGLGTLVGGAVSQHLGFGSAFVTAALVNGAGVAFFFLYSRSHFLRNRLR